MRPGEKTTAIITCSGRGIGKETALLLAKRGLNVVVCSRTYSEVNSVVEEIEKLTSKSNALGMQCDDSSLEVYDCLEEPESLGLIMMLQPIADTKEKG